MGKLVGILFEKFFMDFVENGLILLRDFFGLEGVLKFQTKKSGRNSITQLCPAFWVRTGGCNGGGPYVGGSWGGGPSVTTWVGVATSPTKKNIQILANLRKIIILRQYNNRKGVIQQ